MTRMEDALADEASTLRARLITTITALRAAHEEENVCSCPDGPCVLGEPWARQLLAAVDAYRRRAGDQS